MRTILFTLCLLAANVSYSGYWDMNVSKEIIITDTIIPNYPLVHEPIWDNEPLRYAQEMPLYPGGEKAILEFIATNLNYPKYEKDNNIQGVIMIEFVVEEDASISNVKTVRNIPFAKNLSQEAERVVKMLKFSKPAYQNGQPVRLAMMLPIRFSLNNKEETAPKK
jgi:TonB family protein